MSDRIKAFIDKKKNIIVKRAEERDKLKDLNVAKLEEEKADIKNKDEEAKLEIEEKHNECAKEEDERKQRELKDEENA